MNSDIISLIKEAEQESIKLYEQKVEESKQILKNIHINAKEKVDAEKAAFNKQSQSRLDAATRQAEDIVKQILDQNQAQCAALQDVANQNMQKSIDYILGKVVG